MSTLARSDAAPEVALPQALQACGLGYRVHFPVPGNRRRKIDVTFTWARVAVFVDGCFWHGCPKHGTRHATNREWWDWKLERNQDRDKDTDRLLADQAWQVRDLVLERLSES